MRTVSRVYDKVWRIYLFLDVIVNLCAISRIFQFHNHCVVKKIDSIAVHICIEKQICIPSVHVLN